MNVLVKGVDNDFEVKFENLDWVDAIKKVDNLSFDIKYGKHNGSLFVFKLDNKSSIMYQNGLGLKEMVSTDLFYRMQRKNKELIGLIKSITGEEN